MNNFIPLTENQINNIYLLIQDYHEKYLKKYGVKLPKLFDSNGSYTKDALVLVYLARGYPNTKAVSKSELTKFVRSFYPDVNDVQQARHLGAQKGWYILAGGRDNIVLEVKRGDYQLYSLEEIYPAFHGHRGAENASGWEALKAKYQFRCATCGSKEGKPNFNWPATKTKLQKAHMNPNKPLGEGNIIPQCQKCNRGDRNRWVYDERGRVIRLANPSVVRNCDEKVKKQIYKILYNEYKGTPPK